MIPTQKKTPEELAALREGHGFFQPPNSAPPTPQPPPAPAPQQPREIKPKKRRIHSLRKIELPLAAASQVQNKTSIPQPRHDIADVAEARRRAAIAEYSTATGDPAAHLKKLTAHPILLVFAYLPAFIAIYTAWNTYYFITPISLIFVSGLLTAYIFWTKKRSRHHAAILLIILVMTLVFGGIHYAPYFSTYAS